MVTGHIPLRRIIWMALITILASRTPVSAIEDYTYYLHERTYNTATNFIADSLASSSAIAGNIDYGFHVAGFVVASSDYRMILQSNTDQAAGAEVYIISYISYANFIAGIPSLVGFSDINVLSTRKIADIAFDGRYLLLLETRTDQSGGGNEAYLYVYNDIAALFGDITGGPYALSLDVPSGWDIVGLTFDGNYRLLMESNTDQPGGSEVRQIRYDTWVDLLTDNRATDEFSAVNISPQDDVAAFAYDSQYHLITQALKLPSSILKFMPPILAAPKNE